MKPTVAGSMMAATIAFLMAGCTSGNTEAKNGTAPGATPAGAPLIVTSPAAQAPVAAPEPSKPSVRTVTIPEGTVIRVRSSNTVSTKDAKSGDTAHASLETSLTVGGVVLAPRGADAELLVSESDPGGRVKGRAQIGVRLASLQLAGVSKTLTTNTYWQEAKGTKKTDAAKVGILTGVGAAIGAIAGGGKGAAIGAGAGAGTGTGVVLATRGEAATIPAESVIEFRLQRAVTVTLSNAKS